MSNIDQGGLSEDQSYKSLEIEQKYQYKKYSLLKDK